ncbi:MAG: peptidase M61 [Bacteroidia bacterium]|nr:peptidase M61 [Bacteroidia bacterium]
MKGIIHFIIVIGACQLSIAQPSTAYTISFENAVHHEAEISATFTNLKEEVVEFRMARTSPGRYALHEFVKNVYNVKATDGKGNILNTSRPDPYSWHVSGHDGTLNVTYTLFANHGDGTYAQIDETHAHLNIPPTFMYVPGLAADEIHVTFDVREDLNWKIATQLEKVSDDTYRAPNFQYFMDSPVEISDHDVRSFELDGQKINFVLHHNGSDEELDSYFGKVKRIVLQQKGIFGELPKFDYGEYSFLACYLPNVTGDAMEHRNSTVLTTTRSLANEGMSRNLGSVSHEFIHVWNVERIRPQSLEPFDFSAADMSGELWFAEGFTNYYSGLTRCRAGLIGKEDYLEGMTGTFNYVWNFPGRRFYNPIEMSYQAPFVDAAKAVDQHNRDNTFISYYSYGQMLGLALDLSLRELGLNLDDYMKLVWSRFGKTEKPYTIQDLQNTLNDYVGKDFGDWFFNNYIHKSEMPDFKRLFERVGVTLTQDANKVYFGAIVEKGIITSNPRIDSPAYIAGLEKGDKIIEAGKTIFNEFLDFNKIVSAAKPGYKLDVVFERFGLRKETIVIFKKDPAYTISLFEENGLDLTVKQEIARAEWLDSKE